MASGRSSKSYVFRVQGLPGSQPDATLDELLRAAVDAESADGVLGKNANVSILPSCYGNQSDKEREKIALMEFSGAWPEFLSALKDDPLDEETIEVGSSVLSFDCHFHGFTQLYSPQVNPPIADVIAIAGLDGHAYGSWKSKGKLGKMWLRHFLSEDLPGCRTMIYGYNSKLLVRGTSTIIDHGRALLNELKKIRDTDELRKRPIIFIAHSFGGILLTHCLVRAIQTNEDGHPTVSALYNATYGMLLFGIPHKGMIMDDIKQMIIKDPYHPSHPLLDEIQSGSSTLALQSLDFVNLIRDRKVASFYETRQTRRLQYDEVSKSFKRTGDYITAVDAGSALFNLPDSVEDKIGLDADHSMMVKFKSKNTQGYTDAVHRLREYLAEAPSVVSSRFIHSSANLNRLRQECMMILDSSDPQTQRRAGEQLFQSLSDGKLTISPTPSSALEAFEAARCDFLKEIGGLKKVEFPWSDTIEEVYDTTDQIQDEQASKSGLRNLKRIQTYLERAQNFETGIKTFARVDSRQIKAIWAPLRFILLVGSQMKNHLHQPFLIVISRMKAASTDNRSFDAVIRSMVDMGDTLPQFHNYVQIFQSSEPLKHVLCLFYMDILDFHVTLVKFFSQKRWKKDFVFNWPHCAGRTSIIRQNMGRHRLLLDDEVTLSHVAQALSARMQAYKTYEESHELHQQQEFDSIKSTLRPVLYDKELEMFAQDCTKESGEWLLSADTFQNWVDSTEATKKILWLKGMPGAGKTYLSSRIIQHLRDGRANIVFAFLSYRFTDTASALKILHSLLFQLVLENQRLRRKVCELIGPRQRQFVSSIESTLEIFKEFIEDAPIFFVLDGLDEISEQARASLLTGLFKLLASNQNAKMLLSSRDEHDLAKSIGPRAEVIRMQTQNSLDIDNYVQQRTGTWLTGLGLSDDVRAEIRQLLKPVAEKAEGMFLYARLVLHNIESQSHIQQIRSEAENLPDGLQQAYGRIISRINGELKPHQREEARTILSWIACARFPLTKNEIQLAVAVSHGLDPKKGIEGSFLDVLQRCGPIIEVHEGFVQFVHFTAKEYLMSDQSERYLNIASCNQNVALACMKYLSSDCFNLELSDDRIKEGLKCGAYVLEDYAVDQWLQHIQDAVMHQESVTDSNFRSAVEDIVIMRYNPEFIHPQNISSPEDIFVQRVGLDWEPTSVLQDAIQFLDHKSKFLTLTKDCAVLDPLIITASQIRHAELLDSLLCATQRHREDCFCRKLRGIYGTYIFKCNRFGCMYFRTGFETRKERDHHLATHERPFKCPVKTCDFAQLGFISQAGVTTHLAEIHQNNSQWQALKPEPMRKNQDSEAEEGDLPTEEKDQATIRETTRNQRLLVEAVRSNNFDYVNEYIGLVPTCPGQLLRQCAVDGSADMMELILNQFTGLITECFGILADAAQNDHFQIVQLLIKHGDKIDLDIERTLYHYNALYWALKNRSVEMVELLLAHGFKRLDRGIYDMIPSAKDIAREEKTMRCLQLLDAAKLVQKDVWIHDCIPRIAVTCFSIRIAKFLLERGAKVDNPTSKAYTALYRASGNASQRAADFMAFLLEAGAQPTTPSRAQPIAERPGPRNIQHWLGLTWDELVDKYSDKVASAKDDGSNSRDNAFDSENIPLPELGFADEHFDFDKFLQEEYEPWGSGGWLSSSPPT